MDRGTLAPASGSGDGIYFRSQPARAGTAGRKIDTFPDFPAPGKGRCPKPAYRSGQAELVGSRAKQAVGAPGGEADGGAGAVEHALHLGRRERLQGLAQPVPKGPFFRGGQSGEEQFGEIVQSAQAHHDILMHAARERPERLLPDHAAIFVPIANVRNGWKVDDSVDVPDRGAADIVLHFRPARSSQREEK